MSNKLSELLKGNVHPDWMPNLMGVMRYSYTLLGLMWTAAIGMVVTKHPDAATVVEAAENLSLIVLGATAAVSKDLVNRRRSSAQDSDG